MEHTPNVDKMDDAELENYAYMLGLNLEEPNAAAQRMKKTQDDFKGLMLEMQQANPKAGSTQGAETADMDSASIEEHTISNRNGLPDEKGLHTMSGWEKPFKGRNMRHCMQKLNNFHRAMNVQVELSNVNAVKDAESAYQQLLNEVTKFVDGAQKGSSLFHGKEEAAMLPAMSSLLIKLYSMGNVFDKSEWIVYDYMMEHNLKSVRLGLALTGRSAQGVQGNMVSTGIEEGQIDRTALQMKKQQGKGNAGNPDNFLSELNQRRLPALGDETAPEQLQRIAAMLEDIELQAPDDEARGSVRVNYFDITKMIHLLMNYPGLMTEDGAEKLAGKAGWSAHEKKDFLNTYKYYKEIAGKTVGEAVGIVNKIRKDDAETAAADSISAGGAQSTVLIDNANNRVLRTSNTQNEDAQEQRKKNNFNYDEAMSRLGEVTGLGSIAGARTTYFKDLQGNLQYGTNMDKAKGESAKSGIKLSFGSEKADSQMEKNPHNIFGHKNSAELEKNAGLIISSFKMQILDYISFHSDRHADNFFIDMDAADPENAFTGIDNDLVFGASASDYDMSTRVKNYTKQAQGVYNNNRIDTQEYSDNTSTLNGFQCIPQETYEAIKELNEKSISQAMMPYLDRAARFAVLRRIRQLKDYAASNSKVVNVRTEDGMEAFRQAVLKMMLKSTLDNRSQGALNIGYGGMRQAPSVLTRLLMNQYFSKNRFTKEESESVRWNSLDAIMKEVYMSEFNMSIKEMMGVKMSTIREAIWDKYAGTESDEEDRKAFIEGKLKMDWF